VKSDVEGRRILLRLKKSLVCSLVGDEWFVVLFEMKFQAPDPKKTIPIRKSLFFFIVNLFHPMAAPKVQANAINITI
tara:strand:+ start:302 stop:532 length:231 start_codon:yes stop_codon:yes gene_type:complete